MSVHVVSGWGGGTPCDAVQWIAGRDEGNMPE